jgi:hypothetical protein
MLLIMIGAWVATLMGLIFFVGIFGLAVISIVREIFRYAFGIIKVGEV